MGDILEKDNIEPNTKNESTNVEDDGKLGLGKFKDANALLEAYNSLQAEFTRRSQRLKELEGQAGITNEKINEKLKSSFPNLKEKLEKDGATIEDCVSTLIAENEVLNKLVANSSSEEDSVVYEKASKRSYVKDRIISDYLSTLNSTYAIPLLDANGTTIFSPEKKPKTISEAGLLATKLLKRQ